MRSDRSLPRGGGLLARLALCVALGASWSGRAAWAADRATLDRVATVETEERGLEVQVAELRRNFTERSGLIGATEARKRYEEGVYQYLIGDYESAATSFYILVQARALATPDLARDADWYLAECLFELDNYRTAVEAYRAIVEVGPSHPYFPDAVRRTLETYALLGDIDAFNTFYNQYIVSGKVPTTELISYTLAKSFYRRGEDIRSKAMFEAIAPGSPYYSRARYFLGVQMIKEGNVKQAMLEFENAEKDPVTDDDHKRVHELSELALARLYYEAGDTEQAMLWYGKVTKGSANFADQLYESAWALIKQGNSVTEARAAADAKLEADAKAKGDVFTPDPRLSPEEVKIWNAAAVQVTLFLEQYPQHRYTASMKIDRGHLQMKLHDYDAAEQNYQKVVNEYAPVVEKLGEIVGDREVASRFLDELTDDKKGASEDLLPGYAEEILLSRPEVDRAASTWSNLQGQRADLAESEKLIGMLKTALGDGTRQLGNFVSARQQIDLYSGNVLTLQSRLVDAEIGALRSALPAHRAELVALQKRRDNAYAEAAASRDINVAVLNTLLDIRKTLAGYRSELSDASSVQTIDASWAKLVALNTTLAQTRSVIVESEARELDAVRSKLDVTTARVSDLRTSVNAQSDAVTTLAEAAVQSGVRAVESDFRADVLSADKGIVDVAWLRKSSTTDEMETISKEQVALLKSIKEQYAALRANADQEGGK